MNKIKNLGLIILLVITCNTPIANASDKELGDYVNGLLQNFFTIAKDANLNEDKKVEMVRSLLSQNLDFDWMAKFTLGRYRKGLSASEIDSFSEVYKKYLLTTYGNAVRQYKGQDVRIKAVQAINDAEFVVKTLIIKASQEPLGVDYLVRQGAQGYRVFDVVTEGVSLINSQQSEFASVISNNSLGSLKSDLASKSQ
jgi:phospholipid transport system substrate-binding protein